MQSRRGNVSWEIESQILSLVAGDTIEVRAEGGRLEVHTVVDVKRVNISTKLGQGGWRVPFTSFVRVVSKVDRLAKMKDEDTESVRLQKEAMTLKPNELFYISTNGKDAMLFTFQRFEKRKLIGKNPISGSNHIIDTLCYKGKVSNLQ